MVSRWFVFILFGVAALLGLGLVVAPPAQAAGVASAVAVGGDTLPVLPAREGALAWLWFPQPLGDYDTVPIWRAGIMDPHGFGDLVLLDGHAHRRVLVPAVSRILDRPTGAPFVVQGVLPRPLEVPTDTLRLVNPATGRVVARRNVVGGALSPDGTQMAYSVLDPALMNKLQTVTLATGQIRTLATVDNNDLRYGREVLAWGPTAIYGIEHQHLGSRFWWVNVRTKAAGDLLNWSAASGGSLFTLNANKDLVAYIGQQADMPALMVRRVAANSEQVLDTGRSFGALTISPDGRWLIALKAPPEQAVVPAVDVQRYDLRSSRPPTLLRAGVLPDGRYAPYQRMDHPPVSLFIWSPDSRYVVLLTQDHTGGMWDIPIIHWATLFRVADGKWLGDIDLPDSTGSLCLTNDLRLLAVAYHGDQAALHVYSVPQHQWYQPIPLGSGTPLIVWAP